MAQPPTPAPAGGAGELDAFTVQVAAGAQVYKEGDTGDFVYFVQRGRVELAVEGAARVVLGVAGIGDFFGEAALLDDDPRTHAAKALSAVTLLKIDRATFRQLIAAQPEIASRMLYALIGRDRERPTPEPVSVEGIVEAVAPAPPARVTKTTATPAVHAAEPAAQAPSPAPTRPPAPPPAPPPPAPAAPPAPPEPVRLERATLVHASRTKYEVTAGVRATVGRPDKASGKAPEIDLSPFDTGQTLSRQHALITWRDGVFYVREDKATRNGTFVNGQRVAVGTDTALAPGDRLRFGLVELVFQA